MNKTPTVLEASVSEDADIVSVSWSDGARSQFHAIWLRDGCHDEDSRDPGNGQRLFNIGDMHPDTTIVAATPSLDGGLRVAFGPDDRESVFNAGWLRANQYDRMPRLPGGWRNPELKTWNHELQEHLPAFQYDQVKDTPAIRAQWLDTQRRLGTTLLQGCPTAPGTVTSVVDLFGFVRETNYGRLFDVKSVADPENLAYTSLGLTPHTDNPYRDPVPGMQLLHCIEMAGEGGDSQIVDGLAVAEKLRDTNRDAFDLLCQWPLRFEFDSGDTCLRTEAPMIELNSSGMITTIRYNNRSSTVPRLPFDVVNDFYKAYRAFSDLLFSDEFLVSFKLKPGELFIVDNRRVLHGRSGYSIESGTRHLQGCYADHDSLLSTLHVLNKNLT